MHWKSKIVSRKGAKSKRREGNSAGTRCDLCASAPLREIVYFSQLLWARVACMSLHRELKATQDLRKMSRLINAFGKIWEKVLQKKMLEKDERSRYMYENKQFSDKMPEKKSGIHV